MNSANSLRLRSANEKSRVFRILNGVERYDSINRGLLGFVPFNFVAFKLC
jgi:hypothetical protein